MDLRRLAQKTAAGATPGVAPQRILVKTLELLLSRKEEQAQTLLVQAIKATVQVAMHNGAWDQGAWFLTGLRDPVEPKAFAGSPAEMVAAASFLKAMQELRGRIGRQEDGLQREGGERLTKTQRRAATKEKAQKKEEGG